MKWIAILFVAVLAGLAPSGNPCGGEEPQSGLRVEYNLSGYVKDIRNKELVVVFSEEMIALGTNPEGGKYLMIEPACPGDYFWRGTKTLAFKPKERFRFSTRYQVHVPSGVKALNGKILAGKVAWEFTTPLPEPIGFRTSSQKYFDRFNETAELFANVWVKDSLFIRFNQTVAAEEVKRILTVVEKKGRKPENFSLIPASDDTVEVRFTVPLKRETEYELKLGKGLKGREGNVGTEKEFLFYLKTIPPFRLDSRTKRSIPCDNPDIDLRFSNSLNDDQTQHKKWRQAMQMRLNRKGAIQQASFDVEIYGDRINISIKDSILPGDLLKLKPPEDITNVYGEKLGPVPEIEIRVCSAAEPFLGIDLDKDKPELSHRSMQEAEVTLYKFSDDILFELQDHDEIPYYRRDQEERPGFLHQVAFQKKLVERQASISVKGKDAPDTLTRSLDLEKELGSRIGFFGSLLKRGLPFNYCGQWGLYFFPVSHPFQLQIVHKRNMDFLLRAGPGQALLWAYDNRSGAGISGGMVRLKGVDSDKNLGTTGKDGLFHLDAMLKKGDVVVVRRDNGPDMAFKKVTHDTVDRSIDLRCEFFTDRDFYKPGETLYIGGVVREFREGKLIPAAIQSVTMEVLDPERKSVLSREVTLNAWGGFTASYASREDAKKGSYQILIQGENLRSSRNVRIDYYQPNVFEVTIGKTEAVYIRQDTFKTQVSGAFFSGNPMAGDRLEVRLETSPWPDISRLQPKLDISGFRFDLDEHFRRTDPEYKREQSFNAGGNSEIAVPLKHFQKLNHAASLNFYATGKSAEGKEYTASSSALLLPGKRICGLKVPFYSNAKNEIESQLLLLDEKGATASDAVKVSLYRHFWENSQWRYEQVADPVEVRIDAGKKEHIFRVPKAGYYLLKADASDEAGSVCSTSCQFFAWDYAWSEQDKNLELRSESDRCRSGETLTCYLQSPEEGKALVMIETDRLMDYWTMDAKKTTPIEFKVKKEYFPRFTVRVMVILTDNRMEEASREFNVSDDTYRLQVQISAPETVKPASQQKISLKVTDIQKQGRKAKLFVYAVDEGNLSLSGYRTPQWHDSLYYRQPRNRFQNLFSRTNNTWTFNRPLMDLVLDRPGIYGCVMMPDGSPAPGATVILTLIQKGSGQVQKVTSSACGYYYFRDMRHEGVYTVQAENTELQSMAIPFTYNGGLADYDLVLLPRALITKWGKETIEGGVEGGVVGGVLGDVEERLRSEAMPAAPVMRKAMAKGAAPGEAEAEISGIRVRTDFREVLFFQQVETDERGEAVVDFQTSDQLSTYRIMAVAYAQDAFGSAEKRLLVSKDLLLAEAMPEFARSGDRFFAGVQVSNRTAQKLDVKVLAEPKAIGIEGEKQKSISIDSRSNLLVPFRFKAGDPSAAEVTFYAVSTADKDGLQKKLPVSDNLVPESQLDFDSGRTLQKRIHPQENAQQQKLKLSVSPTILKPVAVVAEKLIFYPYECLEQRTSKLMPYLLLSEDLMSRMEMKVNTAQVRQAVEEYIRVLPEFLSGDGGLAYYRGSSWSSDYLTAYVLWALHLARTADYKVDQTLVTQLEDHLARARLSPYCQAFYQFVLSLGKRADKKKINEMFDNREKLPLPGRVFLYRALGYQMKDRERQKIMAQEFKNSLQVESDFAYFDVREFAYDRDLPFYSSRYATALILQAMLEWEDGFVLAPRVMNWLLEAPPYAWHTTQCNFWILYAASAYVQKVEKGGATQARAEILGTAEEKRFTGPQDAWKLEKNISQQKSDFDLKVSGDQMVYLTTELNYKLLLPGAASRGIVVQRNIYGEDGKAVSSFKKGSIYQVELLLNLDKEVPYAVIDEPLAAGFELLRQDIATTRQVKEFHTVPGREYGYPWMRQENFADRTIWYSYGLQGRIRVVYFIKAMYSGEFTWLPAVVQGMYHPQYFGRCGTKTITVIE